jgi:hypothetical protein
MAGGERPECDPAAESFRLRPFDRNVTFVKGQTRVGGVPSPAPEREQVLREGVLRALSRRFGLAVPLAVK